MMRTPEKDFALLYFEDRSELPVLHHFTPGAAYQFQWFDVLTGTWKTTMMMKADAQGTLRVPAFPNGKNTSSRDWAAKITRR
jgi:hypothetical protein